MPETNNRMAVTFRSIGCRTNQEEMVSLSAELAAEGFRTVERACDAGIIIVNTCSVTALTESKTRNVIRSLSSRAPAARILVTGCLAQQQADELKKIDGVEWVVGNSFKSDIADILGKKAGVFWAPVSGQTVNSLGFSGNILSLDTISFKRTRFPVKIQEGCDFHCSYCIVPRLRGRSRSASAGEIVDVCRRAVAAGYKEIVLTGTHIGQFRGRKKGEKLSELIRRITAIDGDFRIRLSSLDPRDCSEVILHHIASNPKVCRHIHVSLQSCSEGVLQRMNRSSTATLKCIERLIGFRKRYPLAGIGADLIVGFPGETDEQFEKTCRQVACIGLSYAHVFRFSPRPGTAAAGFPAQVDDAVKSYRSARLRGIAVGSRDEFLARVKGTRQRVIVETTAPMRGVTSNYLHVEIPDVQPKRNSWLEVTVTGTLRGRYCSAQPVLCKVA